MTASSTQPSFNLMGGDNMKTGAGLDGCIAEDYKNYYNDLGLDIEDKSPVKGSAAGSMSNFDKSTVKKNLNGSKAGSTFGGSNALIKTKSGTFSKFGKKIGRPRKKPKIETYFKVSNRKDVIRNIDEFKLKNLKINLKNHLEYLDNKKYRCMDCWHVLNTARSLKFHLKMIHGYADKHHQFQGLEIKRKYTKQPGKVYGFQPGTNSYYVRKSKMMNLRLKGRKKRSELFIRPRKKTLAKCKK